MNDIICNYCSNPKKGIINNEFIIQTCKYQNKIYYYFTCTCCNTTTVNIIEIKLKKNENNN